MYGLQTSSTQDLPAPNNSFVIIYDTFVQLCENISDGHAMLARHWNNKGNSMEAWTLLLAESDYHDVVVLMAWIVLQLQFKDSAYPWKAKYLLP